MSLAIDAVQNFNVRPWSIKQVVRMLEILEPYNLAWAEEMLPPYDPAPYAELRRLVATPISGGEGITTSVQLDQWLRAGAVDLAQPDATIIGGISEARRSSELAAARGIQVALHVWGCAPAVAANYHLAFTTPSCVMLEFPRRRSWHKGCAAAEASRVCAIIGGLVSTSVTRCEFEGTKIQLVLPAE